MKAGNLWVVFLLGCIPAIAWGQSPIGTEVRAFEMNGATVLVLGVSTGRTGDGEVPQFDSAARGAIQARVKALYPTASIASDSLAGEDLGCRSKICWVRLAAAHQANYLIVGSYTDSSYKYKVQLALIDNQGEFLKLAEKDCTQCEAAQKRTRLTDAVGLLFQQESVESPLPSILPKTSKAPTSCPQYLTFQRGLAVGVSSSLLLAGLVTAGSLSVLNGQVYSQSATQIETFSFGKQQAIVYGLSVLPAVGLGLSLGLKRPSLQAGLIRCPTTGPCPAAEQARTLALSAAGAAREGIEDRICIVQPQSKRTFARGFALGALGGLVATSLVATAIFGSLNGTSYDAERQFSLKGPAIASGVLLGAAAVGFVVAFPW